VYLLGMRKVFLALVVTGLMALPAVASAKLPYFGFEVSPLQPRVAEPITLSIECFDDAQHTKPISACLGATGTMAWVHPLDDEGHLDRQDWIPVEGHRAASGETRGRIVLDEPGSYLLAPLWRDWGRDHSEGFPSAIRIEVAPQPSFPVLGASGAVSLAAVLVTVAVRRRRHHLTRGTGAA
jgi:hypothetical protein